MFDFIKQLDEMAKEKSRPQKPKQRNFAEKYLYDADDDLSEAVKKIEDVKARKQVSGYGLLGTKYDKRPKYKRDKKKNWKKGEE